MIWDIAVYIIAFFVTVPILVTWAVYAVHLRVYKDKWQAIHSAVNWTTVLYLLAVLAMLNVITGQSFIGIVLALLLTIFTAIVVVHWKVYHEIVFRHVFKIFWRICFLLFLLLYSLLILLGLFVA